MQVLQFVKVETILVHTVIENYNIIMIEVFFIIHGHYDTIRTYTIKGSRCRAISSITILTSITVISTITYGTIGFGAWGCNTNHKNDYC